MESQIYTLRTTANREDQVLDFVAANVEKKGLGVFSLFRPHGLRGYIFIEAASRGDAEEACAAVPYARGLLAATLTYQEVEHMLEQAKVVVDIRKNDIVEIITGPFKREKAKVVRIDEIKEEVVVELLEAAVPIPITVKLDSVKVIRREGEEDKNG
ncbi:transcription elongation factor Spt5 [Candidatus Woesearchaeota archaeon]|nr:transcription elongation factor Spt5 [Candidatus Woesearchaeota archaeon]